jgi:peptidoglycan/xylan/chitin deacetylase (PgdA/CDA1 family)
VRSSLEYKVGAFVLHPVAAIRTAIFREKFFRTKRVLSSAVPALAVHPDPVRLNAATGLGEATLVWWPGTARMVEVRVGAPDGPLFVRAGSPGEAVTGKWIRDGMTFYLQDVTEGLPLTDETTLATARIRGVMNGYIAKPHSLRRATRLVDRAEACSGVILMYHRITTSPRDPWRLNVSPQNFEQHLAVLCRHYCPTSLTQAVSRSENRSFLPRAVVVTFDDGYRDNFVNAKPLLEKYEVPSTVFLTSMNIETGREFWWDEMERLLSQTLSPEAFNTVYNRMQFMTSADRRAALDDLRDKAPRIEERACHAILSPEDVLAFDGMDLFEIGSHTATHPVLTTLRLEDQREEIVGGKLALERILGHPLQSFSYPYGRYSAATARLVEAAGFQNACSTQAGTFTAEVDRFSLPRVHVEDCDGEEFARRMARWFES